MISISIYRSSSATEYIADDDRPGGFHIVSKYPLLASDACVEEMASSSFFFSCQEPKEKKKQIISMVWHWHCMQAQHSAVGYDRYGWRVAVAPKIPTRRATATAHRPETVVGSWRVRFFSPSPSRNSRERESCMHLSMHQSISMHASHFQYRYLCKRK